MATIVTRTGKGSALTFAEVDANFTNLNVETTDNTGHIATLTSGKLDKTGGTITGALAVNGNLTLGANLLASSVANSQSGATVTLTVPGNEVVRLTNSLLTQVSGIGAGSAGQKLIILNRTGTTVEFENESPSAALPADQMYTGTGGSLLLQNNAAISLVYDGTASRWNIIGGTGSGAGAGGINYILNPDAAVGITGYATYNDGTAAPVDGSGGTPPAGLWVRSTTTPLRGSGDFNLVKTGAVSYQGAGVAYDFTIDRADLAKVLTVTFDYEVLSGTYASGDVAVYIIQDPAGTPVVIQPAGYQVQAATVGTTVKEIATFQTASNVTNYRLCIHVASASTQDYTLALDNISVGPQVVQYGAPVTDKRAFTMVVTGTTTNPTFGTQVVNTATWRRVGDCMEISWQYRQSTAGTAGSGAYLFALPSGYAIDTSKLNVTGVVPSILLAQTVVGAAGVAGSGNQFTGYVAAYDSTRLYMSVGNDTANPIQFGSFTSQNFSTAVFYLSFTATVPILGWSSTVQMSNDTDTRVVAAQVTGDPASAAANNPIIFPTTTYDTHGAYNASTGRYTAPVPGFYRISGFAISVTAGTSLAIFVNGTQRVLVGNTDSNGEVSYTGTVQVNAGDLIDLRPLGTLDLQSGSTLCVERLSGPSAIAASETVAAKYETAAGQSIASGGTLQVLDYGTKVFDSHGSVTTGASWKFTAPVSGTYRVSASARFGALAYTIGLPQFLALYKNGVLDGYFSIWIPPVTSTYGSGVGLLIGSMSIKLLAGEYVDLRVAHGESTARTMQALASVNQVSIERLGN